MGWDGWMDGLRPGLGAPGTGLHLGGQRCGAGSSLSGSGAVSVAPWTQWPTAAPAPAKTGRPGPGPGSMQSLAFLRLDVLQLMRPSAPLPPEYRPWRLVLNRGEVWRAEMYSLGSPVPPWSQAATPSPPLLTRAQVQRTCSGDSCAMAWTPWYDWARVGPGPAGVAPGAPRRRGSDPRRGVGPLTPIALATSHFGTKKSPSVFPRSRPKLT